MSVTFFLLYIFRLRTARITTVGYTLLSGFTLECAGYPFVCVKGNTVYLCKVSPRSLPNVTSLRRGNTITEQFYYKFSEL